MLSRGEFWLSSSLQCLRFALWERQDRRTTLSAILCGRETCAMVEKCERPSRALRLVPGQQFKAIRPAQQRIPLAERQSELPFIMVCLISVAGSPHSIRLAFGMLICGSRMQVMVCAVQIDDKHTCKLGMVMAWSRGKL